MKPTTVVVSSLWERRVTPFTSLHLMRVRGRLSHYFLLETQLVLQAHSLSDKAASCFDRGFQS